MKMGIPKRNHFLIGGRKRKETHNAQNVRVQSLVLFFFFLTEEEAANCPKSHGLEISFHHITMLSLSRIPWRKKCKKTSRFPASLCRWLLRTEHKVTLVLYWRQLKWGPTVTCQQGKESAKNNWLSSEIFSDVGFWKSEQTERTGFYLRVSFFFFFFAGYHLPQMLVNPKFCLFAGPSGFSFLTPPQLSLRLWLLLFMSLTPWCILHTLASQMFIFSLGNRWDKERLLVRPDPHLAPKGESGFWFFLPERGFWAK